MDERTPVIRFKGFTDDWEQRKLGELADWFRGKGLSKNKLNNLGMGKPAIHYADLYKFNAVQSELKHWTESSEGIDLPSNSVLFPMSDVTPNGLARTSHIIEQNGVKVGGDVLIARLTDNVNPFFMSYNINANSAKILSYVTGTTVKHISAKSLSLISYGITQKDEQQKIGELFLKLDNLIALHQRKLRLLQEQKKGLLQKMFPKTGDVKPKLRFSNFTDDWEQRKLGDVVDVLDGDRGKNYPKSDDFSSFGHTIFLSASNVTKNGFSFNSNQYISELKSNSMGNGKLNEDDIVLTSRGSIGHVAWYNSDIFNTYPFLRINSGMLILRHQKSADASYFAQYLKSPTGTKKINLISFGSAQPQLTKKDIANYKIEIPFLNDEQRKIGLLFEHLDNLITLHQRIAKVLVNLA